MRWDAGGNALIFNDYASIGFGTSNDAMIYYDVTNLIINPDNDGSGVVKIEGDLHVQNGNGLVIGHTAQMTGGNPGLAEFQILGTTNQDSSMTLGRFSGNDDPARIAFFKSRGTVPNITSVTNNDRVGEIEWYAANAASPTPGWSQVGMIRVRIDDTDYAALGGEMVFLTATQAGSMTERFTIAPDGKIGINVVPDSVRSIYSVYDHSEFSGSSQLGMDIVTRGYKTGSSHGSALTGIASTTQVHASNDQNWTGATAMSCFSAYLGTQTNSTGTIQGASGYQVSNPDEYGATFINLYGFYSGNLTAGDNDYAFYSAGSVQSWFGGAISAADVTDRSDARVKTNVQTISSALSKVSQMRGVSFDRLDGHKSSVGLIAQELEAIAPELIRTGIDAEPVIINEGTATEATITDIKSINYGHLVAYLIEAIKELKAEVDALKA